MESNANVFTFEFVENFECEFEFVKYYITFIFALIKCQKLFVYYFLIVSINDSLANKNV